MRMFNLDFAGKASIFITTSRKKYMVVASGVHFVDDIFLFTPNYRRCWYCDKLYTAILIFNTLVKQITSSLDWFSPEFEQNVYDEIFIKD